jgi:hypothetical protein
MQQNDQQPGLVPEVVVFQEWTVLIAPEAIQDTMRLLGDNQGYQAALAHLRSTGRDVCAGANTFGWARVAEDFDGARVHIGVFIQSLGEEAGMEMGLLGLIVRELDAGGRPEVQERWEIIQKPAGVAGFAPEHVRVTSLRDISPRKCDARFADWRHLRMPP